MASRLRGRKWPMGTSLQGFKLGSCRWNLLLYQFNRPHSNYNTMRHFKHVLFRPEACTAIRIYCKAANLFIARSQIQAFCTMNSHSFNHHSAVSLHNDCCMKSWWKKTYIYKKFFFFLSLSSDVIISVWFFIIYLLIRISWKKKRYWSIFEGKDFARIRCIKINFTGVFGSIYQALTNYMIKKEMRHK